MAITKLNTLSREEYLKKRRKKKFIRFGVLIALVFIFVGLLSYVSQRSKLRINDVVLSGGVLVAEKDIREESLKFLGGSYFWLFPRNNSFIYPKNKLENYLKENFKRMDTIAISLENLNKMIITITERKPVAIWCNDLGGEKDKCYFLDANSTIFAEAPNFSGDAYFKYYGGVENENPIGLEYIASSTEFTRINNFIELVKKLEIKPLHLKSTGEGEFSLVLFGGGEIYFDVKKPLEMTYKNLESLLNSSEISNKNGILPVEYIDLRYGNKLFYKLKAN